MSFTRSIGYRSSSLTKPARANLPTLPDDMEDRSAQSASPHPAHALASLPRAQLPAESELAASRDPIFQARVAQADRHRDERHWREAELMYAAALELYPYQPGYWVQLGHMRKEQARFDGAEIAYRTAAALGVSLEEVAEHLRFVLAQQGSGEARHPIRLARPDATPAETPPSQPDVLLLARLLWRTSALADEEMLPLLRDHASLDQVFAAMVAQPRFAQANVDWLTTFHDEDLAR